MALGVEAIACDVRPGVFAFTTDAPWDVLKGWWVEFIICRTEGTVYLYGKNNNRLPFQLFYFCEVQFMVNTYTSRYSALRAHLHLPI